MSDDEIRGLMAGPFPRTKPTAGFIAFARAVERATRAAERDAIDELLRDMIEVDGYGPKNTHWNAALQRAIDALRARAEGDGEGKR